MVTTVDLLSAQSKFKEGVDERDVASNGMGVSHPNPCPGGVGMGAAVLVIMWSSMSSQNLEGQATYYSPGLMERVAENRGMDLSGYAGGVALNRKGDLGRAVWLDWGGVTEGPFRIVDCARRDHYKARERKGYVVEVDAQTAKRHGFFGIGPVPVKVYFDDSISCTLPNCAIPNRFE